MCRKESKSIRERVCAKYHELRANARDLSEKPKSIMLLVATGTLGYILIAIGSYVWSLRFLPLSTTDPAPWGQFGDYVGGVLNPLFALLNVVLVAYIALAVQSFKEKKQKDLEESEERVRTTLDLHREWCSESLFRSRTLAGNLVQQHIDLNLVEIERIVPQDSVTHVWIVIGFFQRLAFLLKHHKIDTMMATELFGELFLWWWIVSFKGQLLPCDWDAASRIIWLHDEWLIEETTSEQRVPWERRAERDLNIARMRQ
ncbi:hypothetical protein [Synechococcus sp. CCAP 1479/9]|uniref:hypothetical protein n=1 Tax=Synechococcus sp. CCAP 1479/9 TaxID=1221593 RepID=UPI001C2258C8|nr:hypothetical protein [Synechococcus sp. CCAP 1479/9]